MSDNSILPKNTISKKVHLQTQWKEFLNWYYCLFWTSDDCNNLQIQGILDSAMTFVVIQQYLLYENTVIQDRFCMANIVIAIKSVVQAPPPPPIYKSHTPNPKLQIPKPQNPKEREREFVAVSPFAAPTTSPLPISFTYIGVCWLSLAFLLFSYLEVGFCY